MEEDEYEDGSYDRNSDYVPPGYSGRCPICGALTIDCVVADGAYTECNYVETFYTGTIYG